MFLSVQNSQSGDVINSECVVDQEPPNRYELLLKVNLVTFVVARVNKFAHWLSQG